MKKIFLTGFALLLTLCLIGCGGNANKAVYNAGTYTAAAPGMNGDVNVSVTFSKLKQPAKRNKKNGEYKSCNNYTICNYNYKNIPS